MLYSLATKARVELDYAMRELAKLAEPTYLARNAQRLTNAYLLARRDGQDGGSPWRHPEIRKALNTETADRCAYCDSNVRVVAYEHVEHILPRSRFPEKVVEWHNLTVVCPRCNQNKSDYYSESTPLLNPYTDKPRDHLIFLGPLVFARPGNDRGGVTVRKLRLSRAELTEARTRRLDYVNSLVEAWTRADDSDIKATIADFIVDDYATGEYEATVEAFLVEVGFF
jgi:hypothetical protein